MGPQCKRHHKRPEATVGAASGLAIRTRVHMTVRKFTLVCAAVLLAATQSMAAEIKVSEVLSNPHWVSLGGYIEPMDAVVFKKRTEALKGDVTVWLGSPGGAAGAAIQIGNFIHMNQWTTSVGFGSVCNSACAVIWLSGVHRRLSLDGRIGMHSVAMADDPTKRNNFGNGIVFNYLRSIGISEEIIDRFYRTEPTSMDYIDYEQALRYGLLEGTTPPPSGSRKSDRWSPQPIPPAGPTYPLTKINP